MIFDYDFAREKTVSDVDMQIIESILEEKTNIEMAEEIGYSLGSVKKRLAYLFKRYNVKTRVGLIREFFKKNGYLFSEWS